jgi:hypothetical protein
MSLNRHKRVNRTFPLSGTYFSTDPGFYLDEYSNEPWDHYSRDFNSLGYKGVNVINASSGATYDSAHYAYEEEAALPPGNSGKFHSVASFTELGNSEHIHNQSEGIFVHHNDSSEYVGKANWVYGDAIRIYTDGTGAGVRFLDSDVFRGGATEAQMVEDSTWSDFGGIIAATTDSAPDITFRTTTWDSSPDWGTHNYLLATTGDRNYFGNSNYVDFQIAQNIVPFEYDSSDILYTQAAFDSASAAGGGGGGGGAPADPESWS